MASSGKMPLDELLAHADWLARLARQLVRDDAEDVVQETWVAALRSPPAANRPARPWLAEVLRNFVRRRVRSEGRRRHWEEAAAAVPHPADALPADALYERVALERYIAERVMELSEPYRQTILLRFFEGRSAAEIARLTGVPAGTVRWRLREALARLRADLDTRPSAPGMSWRAVLSPLLGQPAPLDGLHAGLKGVVLMAKAKLVVPGLLLLVLGAVTGLWVWQARPAEEGDTAARRAEGAALLARGRGGLRVFGAAVSEAVVGGVIEGIVQEADGAPVSGAVVAARRSPSSGAPGEAAPPRPVASTRADGKGRFVLSDVPPGGYLLAATAPGMLSGRASGDVVLMADQTIRGVTLVMVRGGFTLSGRVNDSGGGPIVGAQVFTSAGAEAGFALATTDAQGAYHLNLAPGEYTVVAEAQGYAPGRVSVHVIGDLVRDLRLEPAGRILGRVVQANTEAPVEGAVVRAESGAPGARVEIARSGPDGAFVLPGLNPGNYRLSAAKGTAVGFRNERVPVTQAQAVEGVRIALERAHVIAGRVVDAHEQPIASAHVLMSEARGVSQGILYASHVVTLTGEDGRYRVEGVLPGRYRLGVNAVPHAPAPAVEVEVKNRDLEGVDFALQIGARVDGTVLSATGRPVVGARVAVAVHDKDNPRYARGAGRARTDGEGRFTVEGLGPGLLSVGASHLDHPEARLESMPLGPGERKQVTVTFARGAFIEGRVDWDVGGPAARTRVRWIGGHDATALTKGDGSFRLGPVPAGQGMIQAEQAGTTSVTVGGGESPHKARLSVNEGETARGVTLVLPKADRTISGVVLGPDGKAAAGAMVGPPCALPRVIGVAPKATGS